jgi:hypothetical protein
MTKACHLKRGDDIQISALLEVLSIEPMTKGFVKIKAAAISTPSPDFGICKGYRDFIARPYRDGRDDNDDDDGGTDTDPSP